MPSEAEQGRGVGTNDAGIPMLDCYIPATRQDHPALVTWRARKLAQGGPYRPDVKMYVGSGSPEATAGRLELLQLLGMDSILLAWDLPSQLGLDPDHRLARSQVGRAGVSCSTLKDMETICSRVNLTDVKSLGLLANSVGHIGFGLARLVLEQRSPKTPIMLQNDPLKEFTARGTDIFEPAKAMRLACDVVEYAVVNDVPGHAMTVCSNHYDVAGAGPVVALAIALCNGAAYMDEIVSRGIGAEDAAGKIALFVNERSDFLLTAALFRTTRVLWADLLNSRYGVPYSCGPVHLMGYAHGLETPLEPLVNVPRVAVSVAAATLGGADTLCAAAYDEALRIPSADAAALALRTLEVASLEHGLSDTVDALAGSYKFEALCDEVDHRVRDELRRLDDAGGAIQAIESGYITAQMSRWQEHRTQNLESGARPWVGVNRLQSPENRHLFSGASGPDESFTQVEQQLADRARAAKARPSPAAVSALRQLTSVIAADGNSVPATMDALRDGATIGQITEATRSGLSASAAKVPH